MVKSKEAAINPFNHIDQAIDQASNTGVSVGFIGNKIPGAEAMADNGYGVAVIVHCPGAGWGKGFDAPRMIKAMGPVDFNTLILFTGLQVSKELIRAISAIKGIVAFAAFENIVPCPAEQLVISFAAL